MEDIISQEDLDIIREFFSHLNLEDEVQFDRGRNVTKQVAPIEGKNIAEEDGAVIIEQPATEEDVVAIIE